MPNTMHKHTTLLLQAHLICLPWTILFSDHLYRLHTPTSILYNNIPAGCCNCCTPNQSSNRSTSITLATSLLLLSKLARRAQPRHRTLTDTSSVLPGAEGTWEQLLELVKECTPLLRAHVRQLHKTCAGREQLIRAPAP